MASPASRWLLVGNSRWHWAEATPAGLRISHEDPQQAQPLPAAGAPLAWAAVGPLPEACPLDPGRRVLTDAVPLLGAPGWLGVDRALAGWWAWQHFRGPVLVADAGTVLSLTLVGAEGVFAGGRLLAGCGLQLRAMAAGTAGLVAPLWPDPEQRQEHADAWPRQTLEAMTTGVVRGSAAAVAVAFSDALARFSNCRLVLTGGDGDVLAPWVGAQLAGREARFDLVADLALRALVDLRPVGFEAPRSTV